MIIQIRMVQFFFIKGHNSSSNIHLVKIKKLYLPKLFLFLQKKYIY